MSQSVLLSDPTYTLLRKEAEREQLAPDALAERLLRERLADGATAWREAVEALISRIQARTAEFGSNEIEADITAAAEEVRQFS